MMLRLSASQLEAIVQRNRPRMISRVDREQTALKPLAQAKQRKYRNKRVELAGMKFDSKKELAFYTALRLREMAGEVQDIKRQVPFDLKVNGHHIARYVLDFLFYDSRAGKLRYVDVKGMKNGTAYRLFRMKQALMLAINRIVVEEV